jgi:hypothetical protein
MQSSIRLVFTTGPNTETHDRRDTNRQPKRQPGTDPDEQQEKGDKRGHTRHDSKASGLPPPDIVGLFLVCGGEIDHNLSDYPNRKCSERQIENVEPYPD